MINQTLVENMDEIYKIRLEMKKLGWESEDALTPLGWKNGYGYSIWFKRSDWHGRNVYTITGHEVSFHEHVKDGSDYKKVLESVRLCAEKSKKAWNDFTDSIPCQYANGIREDIMIVPFNEGETSIRYTEELVVELHG